MQANRDMEKQNKTNKQSTKKKNTEKKKNRMEWNLSVDKSVFPFVMGSHVTWQHSHERSSLCS